MKYYNCQLWIQLADVEFDKEKIMSDEVKRWKLMNGYRGEDMYEHPEGGYTTYNDYDKMKQERDDYKELYRGEQRAVAELEKQLKELQEK